MVSSTTVRIFENRTVLGLGFVAQMVSLKILTTASTARAGILEIRSHIELFNLVGGTD